MPTSPTERRGAAAERRIVRWLRVHSFFAGLVVAFYLTAALDLFVERFAEGITLWLPVGYLASAALGFTLSAGYRLLQRRIAFETLLSVTLAFLTATVGGLAVAAAGGGGLVLAFLTYAWFRVVFFLRNVVFWSLAGFFLDLKQSKRLFGFISSGEALGALTGFAATFALSFTALDDPAVLLAVAAALLLAWLGWLRLTVRAFAGRFARGRPEEGVSARPSTTDVRFRDSRFMALFGVLALLPGAALYVDFVFLNSAREVLGDVGRFVAVFYGVARLVELVVKTRLSGWVVSRWGLLIGLAALPAALLATTLLALVASLFLGGGGADVALILVFTFGSLGRLADRVLRPAFYDPSFQVLFQALPESQRVPFQSKVEGQARLTGVALVGLLLLGLRFVAPAAGVPWLLALTGLTAIVLAWLAAVWAMRGAYRAKLRELLAATSGAIDHRPTFQSAETPAALEERMRGAPERQVVNALDALEVLEPRLAERLFVDFLADPEPSLRVRAVEGAAHLRLLSTVEELERMTATDPDPEVRAHATRAAQTVARALADLGDPAGLRRLARSPDPREREHVARVLARPESPELPDVVGGLLRDRGRAVRMAGIAAAGQARYHALRGSVLRALEAPLLAHPGVAALVAIGPDAIPDLRSLARRHADHPRVVERVLRALEHIGDRQALELIWEQGRHPSPLVRDKVVDALSRRRFRLDEGQALLVRQWIRDAAAATARILAALADLGEARETADVVVSLRRELRARRDRFLRLLQILYDAGSVRLVRERLADGRTEEERAFAVELLDQIVSQELKPIVHAVVDDMPAAARLKRLDEAFPQDRMTPAGRLRDVLNRGGSAYDGWTRVQALLALVATEGDTDHPELYAHLFNADPVLMQAAAIGLREVDPDRWERYVARLPAPERERIGGALREVATTSNGSPAHFADRVAFLKGIPIFAEVPETSFLPLVPLMRPKRLEQGEVLWREGEPSRSVCVVAHGAVGVERGGRRLATVARPEVLGELDLLLARPRASTYVAAAPTRCFHVDGEAYLDVLSAHLPATGALVASFDEV